MTLRGLVKNGVVVFQNDPGFSDGTVVEVTAVPLTLEGHGKSSPLAQERVTKSDGAGGGERRGAEANHSLADEAPVSKERREALLQLIGIWKTDQPPDDDEAERIIEAERMMKYG